MQAAQGASALAAAGREQNSRDSAFFFSLPVHRGEMEFPSPWTPSNRSMLVAAGWAVAAALAGSQAGLVAAVAVAAAAVCLSTIRRRVGPWIWALPAAFAASVPDAHAVWPRSGPVWITGVVQPGIRWEPQRGDCSFRLRHHGQEFLCVVPDAPAALQILPGDQVTGWGRLPDQPLRRREGRLPRVVAAPDGLRIRAGGLRPRRLASRCRRTMQNSLMESIPGPLGALLCHLVLGSGPRLEEDIVRAHRETGLSHLLAVSGAHLTMLGWLLGCAYAVCTRRDPLHSRRFRRGCGGILLFYGLLTGMEPPVFRATVAAFLVLGCAGRHRRVPIVAVLAVPAICTAILAPEDLFGVSFNLSYAAVFGLSLAHPTTNGASWRGPLRCSLWATLCTMPFTLHYFGSFAPWSVLLTPILGPLVAGMLGLGLAVSCTHDLIPDLAQLLALPLRGMAWTYVEAIQLADDLPGTPVQAPTRSEGWPLLLAATLGVAGLCALGGRRGVAWVSLCLAVPHFVPSARASQGEFRLLAVGHGQAALARLDDGRNLLVDCGSLAQPFRAARAAADAILPRRTLDLLVLTHGDADHVGGVAPLLARVRIARAWMPAEMRGSSTARTLRAAGCRMRFVEPGTELSIHPDVTLWRPPPTPRPTDRNAHSVWTKIRWSTFDALLTGDATPESTARYPGAHERATADVLVLPHHGRAQPGIEALVAALRPRLALVSAAAKDGVSAQGRLLRRAGCAVIHTGQAGTVRVLAADPPILHTARPVPLPPRLAGESGFR